MQLGAPTVGEYQRDRSQNDCLGRLPGATWCSVESKLILEDFIRRQAAKTYIYIDRRISNIDIGRSLLGCRI